MACWSSFPHSVSGLPRQPYSRVMFYEPGPFSRPSTAGAMLYTPPSSLCILPCALPAVHGSQLEFLLHMHPRPLSGQLFPFK